MPGILKLDDLTAPPALRAEVRSGAEWRRLTATDTDDVRRRAFESSLLRKWDEVGLESCRVPGFCDTCSANSLFTLDDSYSPPRQIEGWQPNWRERLECVSCGLNSRRRATVGWLVDRVAGTGTRTFWLQEHASPIGAHLRSRGVDVIESEYLGPDFDAGRTNGDGVRHEDATRSSFGPESLDAVVSLDVLEHIPNYPGALSEAYRVLVPGGVLAWTAPFDADRDDTQLLASFDSDGTLVHHTPPEYHGDPLNPERGILCYQRFGWDALDLCRSVGFSDVSVTVVWSAVAMIIGPPLLFVACHKAQ